MLLLGLAAASPAGAQQDGDLSALAGRVAVSSKTAADARARADAAAADLDAAKSRLADMKQDLDRNGDGFLGVRRRRVDRAQAEVRRLTEASIAATNEAAGDADAADADRARYRDALFTAASTLTSEADVAARGGNRDESKKLNAEANADLVAAATLTPLAPPADPWKGYGDIPVDEHASPAELARIAAAYRDSADRVDRTLAAMRPRLEACRAATAAWNRLNRFQGVLQRGGTPAPDPAPACEKLAGDVARGENLSSDLRSRAAATQSASTAGGSP